MARFNIDTCAMLVEFSAPQWTARRLDRNTSDEVVMRKGAAAKDAARVNKHLLAGRNELEVINKKVNAARTYVYENTLPWSDSGVRLLPTKRFTEFNERMMAFEQEFVELVNEFVAVYPSLITAQAMALGDMFNRSEYPEPHTIARRFAFHLNYMPVPKAGDFRIDVGNEAQAELQEKLAKMADARVEAAMQDARDRLKAHLDRMMKQLHVEVDADGKAKKGKLYDSLIDGGMELCDLLESLNITNDPDIEEARRQLRSVLSTVDIVDLRKHPSARVEIRTQVAEIADKFNF